MAEYRRFRNSEVPIRQTSDLLPKTFRTPQNNTFFSATLDPLVQPGVLDRLNGYIGRRYGKTYTGKDIYLDDDETLRSRYQLEPAVVVNGGQDQFYDYLDLKNQLQFFSNNVERDDVTTQQDHYTWDPPVDWDKFVNYREYFWEPQGPPAVSVFGQSRSVTSSYTVKLGDENSFVFSPDGLSKNPEIILYRGQKYRFKINAPGEGFVIRTNYDTASLAFDPNFPYAVGQLVLFDGKIWRSLSNLEADPNRTVDEDSGDWEVVEEISDQVSSLDFNDGVQNNGIESGVLEFIVPSNAPDVLFYQGLVNPNRVGRFVINDIQANTQIDIDKEVLGKSAYTSSNGIEFTNGLIVEFRGQVQPEKYSSDTWLVSGVGTAITLTRFRDLVVPRLDRSDDVDVVFDVEGFDTQPYDDAVGFPSEKDYLTIAKDSLDRNAWSRYNRWFHRSVLEYAYEQRGQTYSAPEAARAKRPIIEFLSGLQLAQHSTVSVQIVDLLDDFTDDVFSKIAGQISYNVDGEFLFDGAKVLVVADTDSLVNGRIYEVKFVTHLNRRQITLAPIGEAEPVEGHGVSVRFGIVHGGKDYYYSRGRWLPAQLKKNVNQAPLFDVYDDEGASFSDTGLYPGTTFVGTPLLSYQQGNGPIDSELGISLSYQNIENVGDIEFEWNWEKDIFEFGDLKKTVRPISTGYFRFGDSEYSNGFRKHDASYSSLIVDSQVVNENTNILQFRTIEWEQDPDAEVYVYQNNELISVDFTQNDTTFIFPFTFSQGDVVTLKVKTDIPPNLGYYEFPISLEKNPLNAKLTSFTLGQAADHLSSAIEFVPEFQGRILGDSNLRDLSNTYRHRGRRFLKHAGPAPLAVALLCDKQDNLIKSLQYARKSYTEFKNNFLKRATEINFDGSAADFVDLIIRDLTKTKTERSTFFDSDMIGSGAFTAIEYRVDDTGITTFALNERFSLKESNRRAVYVYVNNKQLLHGHDYEFSSEFGFVRINKLLKLDDTVQIREYVSTADSFIPPTPTSMGLYKKYTPMQFVDDTYVEPKPVIQGHDGSITIAYEDFRDELLLELEYRIYNNIKQEYNSEIFDIDSILGGYYSTTDYDRSVLDDIVVREFLSWSQGTGINYTDNTFFSSENTFTYTYSNMNDPTKQVALPGWWRGVYKWLYDTDRPHRCPWEMLGFSEKPEWWDQQYGPAPYTRNNHVLWEDIKHGLIRQGSRQGRHPRYARPTVLDHIPVDDYGELLSPLESRFARNFVLLNSQADFEFGDVSPVEYAWRSSSEWPFALMIAASLLRPFDFVAKMFNKLSIKENVLGQIVSAKTSEYVTISEFLDNTAGQLSPGLIQYLVNYSKSTGNSFDRFSNKIENLDVKLSSRLSGFVDKQQQKYLLDGKNPAAKQSGVFIPQENYDIIFSVSSPIATLTYSGVVVEKTQGGWFVSGYNQVDPFFTIFPAIPNRQDPLISVGGISENFVDWTANTVFSNGVIVRFRDVFYRSLRTHGSGESFDESNWKKLPKLPVIGAVEAQRRRNFDRQQPKKISYGTRLTSIQQVVDLLLGYEQYLKSIGFIFDEYDQENQTAKDWITSAKEFMFWTRHNWAVGSLIALSPSSRILKVSFPVGVAESLLDGFYDYQILRADNQPLSPSAFTVERDLQSFALTVTDSNLSGVYFASLFYVLKENIVVFDDKTVFNDVIYDETSGYRQERIKTQGFRTTDWDGNYTSPGFIFDTAQIKDWQPFFDYKLGDMVRYRSFVWTAQSNHQSAEEFNEINWYRLEDTPSIQLMPNFDYRINQIEEFYDVDSEGVGEEQRTAARQLIGYTPRQYLQDLAENPITQFQLYRGFVRDKGTNNSIIKIFDKLSRTVESSIDLNEEWAFRVGSMGGVDQLAEIEFELDRSAFVYDPQLVLFKSGQPVPNPQDVYHRVSQDRFTLSPVPFTSKIIPKTDDILINLTAGYVNSKQVDFELRDRSQLYELDIDRVEENSHVWLAFEESTWTVLRYVQLPAVRLSQAQLNGDGVILDLNRSTDFDTGDIVGIQGIDDLRGFYKIVEVNQQQIVIENREEISSITADDLLSVRFSKFVVSRIADYNELEEQKAALLPTNAKLWVDNNSQGRWEVIEKLNKFSSKEITDFRDVDIEKAGTSVVYSDVLRQTLVSVPSPGRVVAYKETPSGLQEQQLLPVPFDIEDSIVGKFGESLAISHDGRWLAVGSPRTSSIRTDYQGDLDTNREDYKQGEIVAFAGKTWQVTELIDDQVIPTPFEDSRWQPIDIIPISVTGSVIGPAKQGSVSLYEYSSAQRRWVYRQSLVSPRQETNELFGSAVAISKNGSGYQLAVSAPGSLEDRGRVYLFASTGSQWKHWEDTRYVGEYTSLQNEISSGSIVWHDQSLWQAAVDVFPDGSTFDNTKWIRLDDISTASSLPQNLDLDDSTLEQFDIPESKILEIVEPGDQYGTSLDFDLGAQTLVIGAPRSVVEDSEGETTRIGKVIVYDQKQGYFEAMQVLEFDSSAPDMSGDEYGSVVKLGRDSSVLLVSNPKFDKTFDDQGSVAVFEKRDGLYQLSQVLKSFEDFPAEEFGHSIAISENNSMIAIGARNTPFDVFVQAYFDEDGSAVEFDQNNTRFVDYLGFSGAVYIFEKRVDRYLLTEKLENDITASESFGFSVDCSSDVVAVGSPYYSDADATTGNARLFRKNPNASGWKTIAEQEDTVDIRLVKSIALYDNINNLKIADVDYIDSAKMKILNIADQEIKFKTLYDPAVYSIGDGNVLVDQDHRWAEDHVGELWWDLSRVKWKYYEQDDRAYRYGNWNTLAAGASVDVYEWVETTLLPSQWTAVADTNEGLASGISGQPLNPDNSVLSRKQVINPSNGEVVKTLYYYWVKNSQVVPRNVAGRRISAAQVSQLIENPAISGRPIVGLMNDDQLIAYNFDQHIRGETALMNMQFKKQQRSENNIHREYLLLTSDIADSVPNHQLEQKWLDSLIGSDQAGRRVPDNTLPAKLKYGIEFRPRQSMFVDRAKALEIVVEQINRVLQQEAFVGIVSLDTLNSRDDSPNPALNLYDLVVPTGVDLDRIGTARVRPAVLSAVIDNGRIVDINIIDAGFGYRVAPPVVIQGKGVGARARCHLDRDGRITAIEILNPGKRYDSAEVTVRPFSVLVESDQALGGFWSIYGWDQIRQQFFRTQSQAFDTARFWHTVDWWKQGYGPDSRIVTEILSVADEPLIDLQPGELVRIKEFASGGWAVFEKVSDQENEFLQNYRMVGREQGTIQLSESLYDRSVSGVGYDFVQNFDIDPYDFGKSIELRNIFKAVKEDIFQGEFRIEWNRLFFTSIRYVFSEQQYVDWAFKTSFLEATHNIGEFARPVNFKSDNLDSFRQYIEEVKPYRTSIREYVSKYSDIENSPVSPTDFDLPVSFSAEKGRISTVDEIDARRDQYPWKWWTDNQGYSITEIRIADPGSGYVRAPRVVIDGNGTGARAVAFISNNKVSAIQIIDQGKGYTRTPTISLLGGNRPGDATARAVAIMGNSLIRSISTSIKFDRIGKTRFSDNVEHTDEFVATGFTAAFDLTYLPTTNKSQIEVIKNNALVLSNEYVIESDQNNSARVIFVSVPQAGDVIKISYTKNFKYLDSINRIEQHYAPGTGMQGFGGQEDFGQLMTGFDFGGVTVQGPTFEVTGGWDAAPWFTDTWDSAEDSGDLVFIADGSTVDIILDRVPEDGELLTVYLKRDNVEIRIDAEDFDASTESSPTNKDAVMPTFIGDGSTDTIPVGDFVDLQQGDVITIRTVDSDGSVKISDTNVLDTELSGGSLAVMNGAYQNATGLTAEEIAILGGGFMDPDHVPAPEENVPGQVLDNISVKVFDFPVDRVAPLLNMLYLADGVSRNFDIGITVIETSSLLVYVDGHNQQLGDGYFIDFRKNQVRFAVAPVQGSKVEIVAFGLGGVDIIDYQEIVASGKQKLFSTAADFDSTSGIFVTVNGVQTNEPDFVSSEDMSDVGNKTLVRFATNVPQDHVVKIVVFGKRSVIDKSSIVRVNRRSFESDGSTRSFEIDSFTEEDIKSLVVEVDHKVLEGVDTIYKIYDGSNNKFRLGTDPAVLPTDIKAKNIKVYVNGQLLKRTKNYTFNTVTKTVTVFDSQLSIGDEIKITNDLNAQYSVEGGIITIANAVQLTNAETITATWFDNHRLMNIISDIYAGGQLQYRLKVEPLDINYVWAYKNGVRLIANVDFYISKANKSLYLVNASDSTDIIKIILFGAQIDTQPSGYEIQKDMFNRTHFKRFAVSSVTLTKPLNYFDSYIYVTDASNLFKPRPQQNVPGRVYINGERIEYFVKNGNRLGQLRRGVHGTPIPEVHGSGSQVIDVGLKETIPYRETEDKFEHTADGIGQTIGPLPYTPVKSVRIWPQVAESTIPDQFGPCDQVEVFVSGRRLRKDPIAAYDEMLADASPAGDQLLEAEFAVDGTTNTIRLTNIPPAGAKIVVIRKIGKDWSDPQSAISKFISEKTTKLFE